MTHREAKAITLEVWTFLRDNPEIDDKANLPKYLLDKIKYLRGLCPLCEIFTSCSECPLRECMSGSKIYAQWKSAATDEERQEAAAEIVNRVLAWEPEGA
jgi:hypothetical protein